MSKNNYGRFRAINAVSEKQRRRKVYILVAFGESFPTIYNMPTCDEPMGLRWYSTVLPKNTIRELTLVKGIVPRYSL